MVKGKSNQMGFTLIELIVVMAILALLAGLAVPKFTSVVANANAKANAANLKMLQDAADLYIESEEVNKNEVDSFGSETEGITGKGYLKEVPKPPKGYSDYTITDGVVGGGVK